MQPDRVGAILRAGGEDAGERSRAVVARVHGEHVAVRPVEPGEHDDVAAGDDVRDRSRVLRCDHDGGVGGALEALLGRRRGVGERRLDVPDRGQLDHAGSVSGVA
jgi:hypothetical protein